jgi:hypothetical protein
MLVLFFLFLPKWFYMKIVKNTDNAERMNMNYVIHLLFFWVAEKIE